jgi:hypothetical protein
MASGLLLVIALLVFWPYLLSETLLLGPRSGLGTDIAYRHWPDLTYYARVLREEHQIPLWDDSVAGGRPLAGDPGILWLYPLDLLFLVLSPALAFNWLAAVHISVGGVGSYLFLREVGVSRWAGWLGGATYMLSPKIVAHLAGGHVGLGYGAAWIPWAMLGTHRATRGDWKGTLLAGFALALQLPTHVQIAFYTACLMLAFAAWRLAFPILVAGRKPSLIPVAAIVPCFVAFSAAQLFPLIGILPFASRRGFSLVDGAWYSLPPVLVFTLLSPTQFQFPEWILYPGATSLVLAFVAFFGRRRHEAVFWGGVTLFALLYAVGPLTPLFGLLHRLPGFAQLRVPPRMWFIGSFAMSVLAGLGAQSAASRTADPNMRRWLPWIRRFAVLIYGVEAALAVGFLVVGKPAWRLLTTLVVSLLTVGLLVVHQRRRLSSTGLAAGLIALSIIELVPTARLYTMPLAVDELLAETPALEFLRDQPGTWRVYSTHGELPYGSASHDVEAAEGLLALQVGHYVELIKQASGCLLEGYGTGVPPCLTAEVDPTAYKTARPRPKLLGLLNVRFVLTSLVYDIPGLELVAEFGNERIYENEFWLPRAFVVFKARSFCDQETVLRMLPEIDPSEVALLVDSLPALSNTSLPPARARVTRKSSNSIWVQASAERTGLLVVSRTWMPGWQAWIDGEPARVYRVDYALQGVLLPAGKHVVHFQYQPVGWQLGWPSSAGMVAMATIMVVRWAFIRCQPRREDIVQPVPPGED